jgi:hypothetical protein
LMFASMPPPPFLMHCNQQSVGSLLGRLAGWNVSVTS